MAFVWDADRSCVIDVSKIEALVINNIHADVTFHVIANVEHSRSYVLAEFATIDDARKFMADFAEKYWLSVEVMLYA
jgi:hypothetical protein